MTKIQIDRLFISANPNGTISNQDLELAGWLLYLKALSKSFNIWERTVLSKTDNLNTLFCQRKGSATTTNAYARLLRLFFIHQCFHRYVPQHDYLVGPSNPIADALSREFALTWEKIDDLLAPYLPVCHQPTPQVADAMIAALLNNNNKHINIHYSST